MPAGPTSLADEETMRRARALFFSSRRAGPDHILADSIGGLVYPRDDLVTGAAEQSSFERGCYRAGPEGVRTVRPHRASKNRGPPKISML